ncbi:DNA polymerase III subunit beta [Pseudodesulfovibrio sp.]|uniref:DNA polymerase III subunit beta n=1 Tax=Pseudodesulfovibrio sp. TaxID=2035812 RepID=UPI002630C7F1|nr:DNA polymerase III subunit beta [Pseudodesulfovibrio sp.]MDD3310494.1 DNA polymerase III subunit beta [Pseudodesulfovibrio sp.]
MFLKVNRDEIIEGLQKSANIIPAKTGAAFLRTIWLQCENGNLNVMSTDSNLEFKGSYPASIENDGLAGVQGRAFYDLVKQLRSDQGELTIRTDDESANVLVEQKARKYKFPVNDPEWFQKFSAFPEDNTVFWSGDFLHEIIEKISFCISDEDSMEAIACIYFAPREEGGVKKVEVCGLNGHQFAMFNFLNDDIHAMLPEEGVLIQKKYLAELKKWLTADEIELAISEKRLFFRTGNQRETFTLPLSYYQYPNYHNFLAKLGDPDVSTLEVKRMELVDALSRVALFNTDSNRCAYFAFGGNEVTISAQGQETGTARESLDATFTGSMQRIAFPTRHLIDILNHFNSDTVKFTLTGTEAPCGVTGPDDKDYQVIVMPMMIQEETYYTEENA